MFSQVMACINPAEQYQWQISDLFESFLNSMKDSRARVEIDSQRHEGLCIVKITLWKCRSCPKHRYLFRTLFYVQGQSDITNLQKHFDTLVSLYSVISASESSETDTETETQLTTIPETQVTTVPETPPETAAGSHESGQSSHISTAEAFNRWSPTSSETELNGNDCLIISDTDSDV